MRIDEKMRNETFCTYSVVSMGGNLEIKTHYV